MSINNQSAIVDAQTKELVSVEPLTAKTTSDWTITMPSSSTEDFDPQIDGVSSIADSIRYTADVSSNIQWYQMMALMPEGQASTVASTVVPLQSSNIDVGSQLSDLLYL